MFKKQVWLALVLFALTFVLYGCMQDFLGLKDVDEQGRLQPLTAIGAQFEVVDGKARVLIGFTQRPGPAEQALVRGVGGKVRYAYHIVNAIAATIPEAAIDALRRNPNVTHVDPDCRVFATDSELDNSWGVKHIGAGAVHDGGNKGAGIAVAIIDSGIDYDHPDLNDNYAGGYDFVNTDTDPMDDYGHGTHVAGTVAAEDDDAGVVGVAPEADLRTEGFAPNLELQGRLDRIDKQNDAMAVVDYKTGGMASEEEVLSGESIQLPFYALLATRQQFAVTQVEYLALDGNKLGSKVVLRDDELAQLREGIGERLKAIQGEMAGSQGLPA